MTLKALMLMWLTLLITAKSDQEMEYLVTEPKYIKVLIILTYKHSSRQLPKISGLFLDM